MSEPTDPKPEQTPGLTPGNSVEPGDVPPIESSTSQSSGRDEAPTRGFGPWLVFGIAGLLIVFVLVFVIGQIGAFL